MRATRAALIPWVFRNALTYATRVKVGLIVRTRLHALSSQQAYDTLRALSGVLSADRREA